MILQRFFDPTLAQTSYLIGCGRTGQALVVDPNRDVDQYLRAAAAEDLTVTHVTETHIHADFVSGARDLAARTGAALYLSAEGGADWQYAFAADAGATLVRGGDQFRVGNVQVDVVHTPGHTPEHLSFVVTDTAAADAPMGIVTGDFVFVGDVGRPDLLERAAGAEGTMAGAARTLYDSLQHFAARPEWLQIWPGHGAGSACGKGLSAVPQSTVGYERRFNWAFGVADADAFVRAVLDGQPEAPRYFAMMKRINRDGPPPLPALPHPPRLPAEHAVERLRALLAAGGLVVDTRPAAAYAAAHVPGTLNIPLTKQFPTRVGSLLPFDQAVTLIVEDGCAHEGAHCADEAARDLALIGFDHVAGYVPGEVVRAWAAAGHVVGTTPQVTPDEVAGSIGAGEVAVVDVRGLAEWEAGHVPGALHVPLGDLPDRLGAVPRDRPVVVHCQSGARSAIAASVLRAAGVADVRNLAGGLAAWRRAGHPVAAPAATEPDASGAARPAAARGA